MKKILFVMPFIFALACQPKDESANLSESDGHTDVHSFARPQDAVVKHLDLDLKVDFDQQIIGGKASWTIENPGSVSEIIFDTRDLSIEKVTLGDDEKETQYSLGDTVEFLGQPLKIKISPEIKKVHIYYANSKGAAAVQWLNPQQTAGKKEPFMFTQSQAILARTWIPCQDSPGIRFTYSARVQVPSQLLALMSAGNPQAKNSE